ncbi:hypothetical protein ASG23_16675 [Cellulomonas sp. Leaf395]|nr:hypothetical protein ASG23_16675 [Cellulomonas sp. Leaf395]
MAPIGLAGPWGENDVCGCAGAAFNGWCTADACAWYGGGPAGADGAVLCDGIGENLAVAPWPTGGGPACGPTGR